jgi:hypothetical protein
MCHSFHHKYKLTDLELTSSLQAMSQCPTTWLRTGFIYLLNDFSYFFQLSSVIIVLLQYKYVIISPMSATYEAQQCHI